ncbi:MAG TPA: response regulator [Devosia sp.]|nr:response regulator [Devosia sp.]
MHIEISEAIRSVLIVEDEALVAMMMEELVRELGVTDVHVCGDVASALELARLADIDCAVLDIRLRDGSSIEVADALAARGVPFMFSTGSDSEALEGRHAGRPFIGKPFRDDDFTTLLLDTCRLGGAMPPVTTADALRVATFTPSD